MSNLLIFDIVGFVLQVQLVCMSIIVFNFFNVDIVVGFVDVVYKLLELIFQVVISKNDFNIILVKVKEIIQSEVVLIKCYELGYLLVDVDGYIYQFDVDLVVQMVNLILILCNYQVGVEMLIIVKELVLVILIMGC